MSLHFREHWASLGIEEFVGRIIVNTSLDMELMSVVLKFWSKSINSFLLLFGPVFITLRDITILTRLPIQGVDALCLLDAQDSFLPSIEFSSTTQTSYSSNIQKWYDATKTPSTVEHVEFL